MQHLPLLIYLFVIICSFAFTGFFVYLNFRYSYPLLRYHLISHVAFSFFIILKAISFYGYINTKEYSEFMAFMTPYVTLTLYFVGFICYYQGRSIFFILNLEWTPVIRTSVLLVSLIPPAIATYMLKTGISPVLTNIAMGTWLLFQIILYILGIFKFKTVTDPLLKYIIKIYFLMVILLFPIGILEYIVGRQQVIEGKYPLGIMAEPLNHITGMGFVILVLLKAKTLFRQTASTLPQGFLMKFALTDREQEIVHMIQFGMSNKEIADKLFLSPSTVRNHISNIFEKTRTSTRGKLLHLINGFHS